MSVIDDYILKATTALRNGNASEIDAIAREIVSAFHSDIPNLAHYRGMRINDGSGMHTATDLQNLIGKLRVLREKRDDERYGVQGLSSISDSIRQLEDAIADDLADSELDELYRKIDHIYTNYYDSYVDGLENYLRSDAVPNNNQTQLRIEKLRNFRDEELRKQRIAESQAATISLNQRAEAIASNTTTVSISSVNEQISSLPDSTLTEDDKTLLKGLLFDLEDRNQEQRETKLHKVLGWLSDKGTDVFLAVMPYVVQLMQS